MASSLSPCPSCSRHVRASGAACPFCGAEGPARDANDVRPLLSRPKSRAAILFAGAAVVGAAACSSETLTPLYGAPAVDSGVQEDSGNDSAAGGEGGPVALYGPAPVDGGQGDG